MAQIRADLLQPLWDHLMAEPFVSQKRTEERNRLAKEIAECRDNLASEEEREAASNEYASDEVEIDDDAGVSHADDGYWVQAWVWVATPEVEDEESEEELLDKADQKHNAQMLDGCETDEERNAELRAQTQGR